MELRPAAVIAGRYRVDRKIGSGGMGEVWAGEHVSIGVRVAMKTLLPAAALDPQVVARFRREAMLLGRLRSDRVARVVDFIEDKQFGLVLVMDFVEGESLGSVLMARRIQVEEAIDLGIDIAAALCDLHRAKIVHRDLKPDNIILEPLADGQKRAVIVDFGVSRLETGSFGDDAITSITHADMAVGTLPYMAPEQLLSSRTVTGAADLYALGAILFRAVSGQQVFDDADADSVKRKITGEAPPLPLPRFDRIARGFADIVARALRRNPEERFESAETLHRELLSLRDVARALGLDLDAATEEAPPPGSGGSGSDDAEADADTGEMTKRMSRPPMDDDAFFDEATVQSPGALAPLQRADEPETHSVAPTVPAGMSPKDAATIPVVLSSTPATVETGPPTMSEPPPTTVSRSAPPAAATSLSTSSSSLSVRMTRPTVLSPEPTPGGRLPRTLTLRAAVLGMIVALLAGAAIGAGVEYAIAAPRAGTHR